MGIWGAIKSMFGMGGGEPEYQYVYGPPVYRQYTPAPRGLQRDKGEHWDELKKELDERMEYEKKKREHYGV